MISGGQWIVVIINHISAERDLFYYVIAICKYVRTYKHTAEANYHVSIIQYVHNLLDELL